MADHSRQLKAQALSKRCGCLQEHIMALYSSRDHISLEWSEYVLALVRSKIDTITNDPPKRCFPEDTMQIKLQVYLATFDCTCYHFHIVVFREQKSS